MEFVEHDQADRWQLRVVLEHAGEYAFGDDLDARVTADLGVEPSAVAHRLADGFFEQLRHTVRDRPGGQPARLEHENLFLTEPGAVQDRERDHRTFSGAWRSHQQYPRVMSQRLQQCRQCLDDGERG